MAITPSSGRPQKLSFPQIKQVKDKDKQGSDKGSFHFSMGDNISIISDKAFRKTSENVFEAIGNVVITHFSEALYGETAVYNMATGEIRIKGNVRYVGLQHTIYGSELDYNSKTQKLNIQNARIASIVEDDRFSVIGKKISRVDKDTYIAYEAEYSTCRDCPESWSVYGDKVHITLNNYVRIQNALFKISGVVVMYLPYIVFPIKKDRQTGLLFPKLGISFTEGVRYRQPFFWAMSDQTDLTLTPGFLGRRGLVGQSRFRHVFGDQKWVEANTLQIEDRIYTPTSGVSDEASGEKFYRHMTDYEHHLSFGHWFNHHATYNFVRDMDVVRDLPFFTDWFLRGSEFGGDTFAELRFPIFNFSIEGAFNRNMIFPRSLDFDDSYIQILPAAKLDMIPISLLQTKIPLLEKIFFGVETEFTKFRQNKIAENTFIRNAERINASPSLTWQWITLGPLLFKTQGNLNYQKYRFPTQATNKEFTKVTQKLESTMSIEVDKIFGLAYNEKVSIERVKLEKLKKKKKKGKKGQPAQLLGFSTKNQQQTVGQLPDFDQSYTDDFVVRSKNSYRHSQEYRLVHHYLLDEKIRGNETFLEQIQSERGWFDYKDAILSQIHTLGDITTRTEVSKNNSLEFQWNNALIRKQAKSGQDPFESFNNLKEGFSYSNLAKFNISQGIELDDKSSRFRDKLTRLHLEAGISLDKFTFGVDDYYFYDSGGHILETSILKKFDLGHFKTAFSYDTITTPTIKLLSVEAQWDVFEWLILNTSYSFDILESRSTSAIYKASYRPANNCWRLEVVHSKNLVDRALSINVLINFSRNSFRSITGS